MKNPSRATSGRLGRAWLPLCGLLLAALPARAAAPGLLLHDDPGGKAVTQYVHDVWTTDDGLPQNTVNAIVQTRDGYLWAGTQEGIVRFDGVSFTVFDRQRAPGLRSNYVWTLYEDDAGRLWAGTNGGGLSRFDGEGFTTFTTADGLPDDIVYAVGEDERGRLWVGTRRGLCRLDGASCTPVEAPPGAGGAAVRVLRRDAAGALWAAVAGGVYRVRGDALEAGLPFAGAAIHEVRAFVHDRQGRLWAGTERGLYRSDRGVLRPAHAAYGLPEGHVGALHADRQGNLWVGVTGAGLFRLRPAAAAAGAGRASGFTPANGLPDPYLASLYEDREGSLWFGTFTSGLNRLKDGKFTPYSTREGLSHDFVLSVLEGRDGALWVGTYGGGLNRLKGGRVTTYTRADGLPGDVVTALWEDRDGALWIGLYAGGLSRLKDGRLTHFTPADGLPSPFILALYERPSEPGVLWIGTEQGLTRLDHAAGAPRFTTFTTADGLGADVVPAIVEDAAGVLWLGTNGGGLSRYEPDPVDGRRFTTFTTADGLSSDYVVSLYADARGAVWAGTDGGGLNRLKDGAFAAVTTRHGLLDDVVFQILEDDSHGFWLSSNKGIFHLHRLLLEAVLDGRAARVAPEAYGKGDGMRSPECNGRRQPSGWKGADGRLWFASIKGVVAVDPGRLERNPLPPPVHVERLLADHAPTPLGDGLGEGLVLAPGTERFEFHYAALSFLDPGNVRFKYRLDGFDRGWIDAGTRRTAYYTNLPPGTYRFRVIAANNDGVWNEAGASVSFRLAPFFYQTRWFGTLLAAVLVAACAAGYRARVRHLKRRTQALEHAVRTRTQEIRHQKEIAEAANTVKTQLLGIAAHDLKNPLSGIRGFAEIIVESSPPGSVAADLGGEIHQASERMLALIKLLLDAAALEKGALVLHRRPVDLGLLAEEVVAGYRAAAHRKHQRFNLVLSPECLVEADAMWLRTVLDNLVSNAVKYSPRDRTIDVRARRQASAVRFEVEDRGPGLTAEDRQKLFGYFQRLSAQPTGGESSTGLGLSIVKQVVELHGGRVWAESEPGRGSTFIVELPALAAETLPGCPVAA